MKVLIRGSSVRSVKCEVPPFEYAGAWEPAGGNTRSLQATRGANLPFSVHSQLALVEEVLSGEGSLII